MHIILVVRKILSMRPAKLHSKICIKGNKKEVSNVTKFEGK